jgi:hypothetical protein
VKLRLRRNLRVAKVFSREPVLTSHLWADSPARPALNEQRHLGGKAFFGTGASMVSQSSSMSLFVGLDSHIRELLLRDSSPADTPFRESLHSTETVRSFDRLSIASSDGTRLDIQGNLAS